MGGKLSGRPRLTPAPKGRPRQSAPARALNYHCRRSERFLTSSHFKRGHDDDPAAPALRPRISASDFTVDILSATSDRGQHHCRSDRFGLREGHGGRLRGHADDWVEATSLGGIAAADPDRRLLSISLSTFGQWSTYY